MIVSLPQVKTNYVRNAVVTKIIDGDTIDCNVDLGYRINILQRFRLVRVNTPELKSKDPEVVAKAKEARTFVNSVIPVGTEITIESHKSDLYDRWLAEIYYDDKGVQRNLSDELLRLNLAVPY